MAAGPFSNPSWHSGKHKPETNYASKLSKLWKGLSRPADLLRSGLQTVITVVRKGDAG